MGMAMGVKSRSIVSFSFVSGTSRKKEKDKDKGRGASLATSVLHHVEEEVGK